MPFALISWICPPSMNIDSFRILREGNVCLHIVAMFELVICVLYPFVGVHARLVCIHMSNVSLPSHVQSLAFICQHLSAAACHEFSSTQIHLHGFHVVFFFILPLRICDYPSHLHVSASASSLRISFIFNSWGPHSAITMRVACIVWFYACLALLSLDGDGYLKSICRQEAAAFIMQCLAWTYWAYVSWVMENYVHCFIHRIYSCV